MGRLGGLCAAALLGVAWLAAGPALAGSEDQPDTPGGVTGFCPGSGGDGATFNDKGLTIKALDGRARLRVGGRLHVDAGATDYSGPAASIDDVRIRRAYVETYLTLCDSFQARSSTTWRTTTTSATSRWPMTASATWC